MDEKDIIGYWTTSGIFYSTPAGEEEEVVFDFEGKGYYAWYNLFFEVIDTFLWSLENDCISIIGHKQFTYRKNRLVEITTSKLNAKDIGIKLKTRDDINGKEVSAIEFSKSLTDFAANEFGLLTKDLSKLKKINKKKKLSWEE